MNKTLTKRSTAAKSDKKRAPAAKAKAGEATAPAEIRTYKAAVAFLNARTNFERMLRVTYNHNNFNLSRMLRLLSSVGNPHKKLKVVHIAGTKGKGSTAHMLASILTKAGYRTGLYTSPHVVELRERIAVNGQMISEAAFTRLMAKVAPAVRRRRKDSPTYFDVLTAMAFMHFVNEEVDIAVVETGLGGRLDSTNVVKPEVCAITNISFDHMAQLGSTLEAIAAEKAGIFKAGAPVVSAPQPPEVTSVLREAAAKIGTSVKVIGEDLEFSYRFERSRGGGPHSRVCVATPNSRFDHLQVPLLGEHQATNCGVALGVIDALRQRGFNVTEQHAIDGLAAVKVEGRLETIRTQPHTIADGAHNAASISALMRAIGQNISYDSMVVIFGCSADKDIDGMLDQLQLGADKVIFTSNGTPRSADPKELLTRFQERSQKMAMVAPTLMEAYRLAMHCVTREDLICITGSFYLVGAAKQELAGKLEP